MIVPRRNYDPPGKLMPEGLSFLQVLKCLLCEKFVKFEMKHDTSIPPTELSRNWEQKPDFCFCPSVDVSASTKTQQVVFTGKLLERTDQDHFHINIRTKSRTVYASKLLGILDFQSVDASFRHPQNLATFSEKRSLGTNVYPVFTRAWGSAK